MLPKFSQENVWNNNAAQFFPRKLLQQCNLGNLWLRRDVCDLHLFGIAKGEMLPNFSNDFWQAKRPLNFQAPGAGRNAAHFFSNKIAAAMRSLEFWGSKQGEMLPFFAKKIVHQCGL